MMTQRLAHRLEVLILPVQFIRRGIDLVKIDVNYVTPTAFGIATAS